jgi:hypothetical protein
MQVEPVSLGQARRHLKHLEEECQRWRRAMDELQGSFAREFSEPPVRLRVHVQAWRFDLRWRYCGPGTRKRGQSTFLMGSSTGQQLLESLPLSVRTRFLQYEQRAIQLNFSAHVSAYAVQQGRGYLRQLENLAQWGTAIPEI